MLLPIHLFYLNVNLIHSVVTELADSHLLFIFLFDSRSFLGSLDVLGFFMIWANMLLSVAMGKFQWIKCSGNWNILELSFEQFVLIQLISFRCFMGHSKLSAVRGITDGTTRNTKSAFYNKEKGHEGRMKDFVNNLLIMNLTHCMSILWCNMAILFWWDWIFIQIIFNNRTHQRQNCCTFF